MWELRLHKRLIVTSEDRKRHIRSSLQLLRGRRLLSFEIEEPSHITRPDVLSRNYFTNRKDPTVSTPRTSLAGPIARQSMAPRSSARHVPRLAYASHVRAEKI